MLAGRLLYFIVAENNRTYTKLRFNVGPGGQILIPVQVDYSHPFGPCDRDAWEVEYKANIKAHLLPRGLVCDDEFLYDSKELDLTRISQMNPCKIARLW